MMSVRIVEDTLKNYKLDQVITGNQINIIINFALNLSKSDILNNEDFTKTLNDLETKYRIASWRQF